MRPTLRFLERELLERIVAEARDILAHLGMEIHNPEALALLGDHGAAVDQAAQLACFPADLIDRALNTAARGFRLYDSLGVETHHFAGDNVYFNPGSAALYILDPDSGRARHPVTADYVRYARLMNRLPHLAAQSTALVPQDVAAGIQDSYRLYLSLLHCEKPVITGAFSAEAFTVMRDLQLIVRGSEAALAERPLTVFSCCPTAPLKWSHATSANLMDCARAGIPVEYIAMPLSGFMAPVTLVGTLVQHTAETLSGIVLTQLVRPGAPALYGGSPAAFDVRYETTPMGAAETMMTDCAYNEIGKFFGLPTQAYTALSDAKLLDFQAGLETAMGATLAVLAGINSVSGPGMLDFESCQSLEKLVIDNEICGLALRVASGIEPRDDFPARPLFEEMLRDKHLLIARHTRKHLRKEHYFPGPVIDRAPRSRWLEEGGTTLLERARREVERHLREAEPPRLDAAIVRTLRERMAAEARRFGQDTLPTDEA